MRIFDVNNNELTNPDLFRGYLREDKIFIKRHEAIAPTEEQWHYEVVREYPNGGKDIKKVIDVFGVEAQEAWDEYEDIQRYIEYTEDELANMDKPSTLSQRLDKVEEKLEETILKISTYLENTQSTSTR